MRKRFFLNCLLILVLVAVMSTSAFAISESDVESAVSASGKEAVSGNVLVWFLCAIAFLKVSQKIDSFLSSLGLNVGHTGGSMLSEAMIAMRAINTATSAVGSALGSRSHHASAPASGKSGVGSAAAAGFFSGGLVGMASRKIASDAVRTATTEKNIVQPQQAEATVSRTHASSDTHSGSQSASEQQRQNTSQLDQNQQAVSSRTVKSEQQERSQQALHESQRSVDASQLHQDIPLVTLMCRHTRRPVCRWERLRTNRFDKNGCRHIGPSTSFGKKASCANRMLTHGCASGSASRKRTHILPTSRSIAVTKLYCFARIF